MSNLGLELALRELGIGFQRAKVGDRYVLAMLKEKGGVIGGETSGHILCLDRTTTGDALVSALQVLEVMQRTGQSLAQLAAGMHKFPQVMLNVRVAKRFDPDGRAGRGGGGGAGRAHAGRRGPRGAARLGHRAADPGDGGGPGRARPRRPAPSRSPPPCRAARPHGPEARAAGICRPRVCTARAPLSSRAR